MCVGGLVVGAVVGGLQSRRSCGGAVTGEAWMGGEGAREHDVSCAVERWC